MYPFVSSHLDLIVKYVLVISYFVALRWLCIAKSNDFFKKENTALFVAILFNNNKVTL